MRLALYAVLTMLAHAYDAPHAALARRRALRATGHFGCWHAHAQAPPAFAALSAYKTELFVESGCGRRGPRGACLDARTAAPRDTTAADEAQAARAGAEKAAAQKARMEQELESPLVAELRRRTEANAEKNARQVELQMFQNSQSGEFGPFSRFVPVAKNDGAFDHVAQLADVSGPMVVAELQFGVLGKSEFVASKPEIGQEVAGKFQSVSRTLSKRWQFDHENVKPIEQVLTKLAFCHGAV